MEQYNVALSGVGGQGVMTVSEVLALAAARENMPVSVFEGTGIAQRGGPVFGFVRLGRVYSPKIPLGHADVIIGLEISEVGSMLPYLRNQGEVWLSSGRVDGYHTKLRPSIYPSRETIESVIRKKTSHLHIIPAERLAREAGSPRAVNMVMLGAFMSQNNVVGSDSVIWAIEHVSPKFASSNVKAFRKGMAFGRKEASGP